MISLIIPPGNAPFNMIPGQRYLLDRAFAADYLKGGADCDERVFEHEVLPNGIASMLGNPHTGRRRILIIRASGIGDVMFLTPALAKLKALYPQHEFTLCTIATFHCLLTHPSLDGILCTDWPPAMAEVEKYDFVIPLEETVERDEERDAMTIFATHLGLTLADDEKHPLLRIPSDVLIAAQKTFPKPEQRRFIGVQLRASHDCRTWPMNYIHEAVNLILSRDPNTVVFLFGKADDFPGMEVAENERVVWLPTINLSLAETLAVLALMDGFIAPDSGLLHAAGALDIPSVGIFGPYQWQQRTIHSPSIRGINGYAECAPCHHKARHEAFPPGMPCAKAKCCIAMAQVTPDRVVSLLKRQMSERSIKDAHKRAGYREHLYAMSSDFGPVLRKGDAHLELARSDEYHLGDWGGGAASIEEAKFLYGLVLALKPLECLETGTETGWTAAHIAKALEENGRGHLTTLEINPKMAALARENLAQWDLTHRVEVVEERSEDYLGTAKRLDGAAFTPPAKLPPIDFALLDTHIELRERELQLLIPHLAPNAFVCVHDTSPQHPHAGETRLLECLRSFPGFDVVHLPTPRGLTMLAWRGNF